MKPTAPDFFKVPTDKDATIRILTGHEDEHFYATSMPEKLPCPLCEDDAIPNVVRECVDGKVDAIRRAFAPYPTSFEYSFEQMQAMNRMRQVVGVRGIEFVYKEIPPPQRKKKSWLRYTSNKKWVRKFPKRVIRQVKNDAKVFTFPKSMYDKLMALAKLSKRSALPVAPSRYRTS